MKPLLLIIRRDLLGKEQDRVSDLEELPAEEADFILDQLERGAPAVIIDDRVAYVASWC
jgi:hypothetical protein